MDTSKTIELHNIRSPRALSVVYIAADGAYHLLSDRLPADHISSSTIPDNADNAYKSQVPKSREKICRLQNPFLKRNTLKRLNPNFKSGSIGPFFYPHKSAIFFPGSPAQTFKLSRVLIFTSLLQFNHLDMSLHLLVLFVLAPLFCLSESLINTEPNSPLRQYVLEVGKVSNHHHHYTASAPYIPH